MRVHDPNSGSECNGCNEKLKQAHPILATWFRRKKAKYPNLHIAWGWRGQVEQEEYFSAGKSDVHYPHSKHNARDSDGNPRSLALDLFQITEDGDATWSKPFFARLNEENRQMREPIRWGGTFKLRNGSGDACHFELLVASA